MAEREMGIVAGLKFYSFLAAASRRRAFAMLLDNRGSQRRVVVFALDVKRSFVVDYYHYAVGRRPPACVTTTSS